jgi:hypothetical protein
MTGNEPLAERLVANMVANRPALEQLMAQESSRALHEEFLLAESGTLPDRQSRLTRARTVGARAWLRHLAGSLAAEWRVGPPDLQSRLERWVATGAERLEAMELEEEAAVEREGLSGDAQADARRVTLGAYMRLFAEGVGEIVAPGGLSGPELGRRVTEVMRREAPLRRKVEKEAFEAWTGSPMEGLLEESRTTAAPPEPNVIRVLEAAAVWSWIRVLADALGEVLEPAQAAAE